jgi:hypothetical protein
MSLPSPLARRLLHAPTAAVPVAPGLAARRAVSVPDACRPPVGPAVSHAAGGDRRQRRRARGAGRPGTVG